MLKVLCVVDKERTALDRLAKGVAKYHDNIDYKVLAVHPKRPDPEQLAQFEEYAMDADIIDWQYFRTAEMLRAKYEWLADIKQVLTHNNPYSIVESDWNDYDFVVANNLSIRNDLKKITSAELVYIPLAADTDFWTYNFDWQPNNNVLMVANRIEGKKGILPVAEACAALNLNFHPVGAISDMDYFHKIAATGATFHQEISDEDLKKLYYNSVLHVCNSVDGFESGTQPILEAMLCGTPVLTRPVGHVPDLSNGENMVIYNGDNEDVEALKDIIWTTLSDKKALEKMRDKAWNSAKTRNFERRAFAYQKLYRTLMSEEVPVSVVVPVYDRPETAKLCLSAIAEQTYKNIEVIVVDDKGTNEDMVATFADYVNFPVRYIYNAEEDYGLARARNKATIEATGEIMVYCDERMVMANNAVEEFVKNIKPSYWLYGNKGVKKEFVENFSAINRDDIIQFGMFCERIDEYGGMSQELRERMRFQGLLTEYVESAKATPTGKSSNRNRKRAEIIRMKNRLAKMYEL
jgi:glycosyltransferase involved in cell wall biosynthesis